MGNPLLELPLHNNKPRMSKPLEVFSPLLSIISYTTIDECKTALEAWLTLERLFGAKAKHSKISLKMQLYASVLWNQGRTCLLW